MDDLRYLLGPPGAEGTPFEGPDSPDGPFGPDAELGAGPTVSPPTVAVGDVPLMQRAPALDQVRVAQNSQLAAEVHNSLVFWGILTLRTGQPASRRWVIDPGASPLFPGGGLTVRANTPGTYGTFS